MPIITITRHYIASNVDDRFSIGDNEHDGNAAAAKYLLPAGYSFDAADRVIRDKDGVECGVFLGPHNGPRLMSLAGRVPNVDLKPA